MRSVRVGVHVVLAVAATSAAGLTATAQGAQGAGRASPGASSGAGPAGSGATPALPPEPDEHPAAPPPPPVPAQPVRPRWGHRGQVGLRLGAGYGGGIAIRYGNGDQCNARGATFCGMGGPLMLDAGLTLGVAETIEIEARFRFGIASTVADTAQWNGENPIAGGLGIRYYGTDSSPFRFAFGVAVFADFTGRGTFASYGTDVQVRLDEGVQYDVSRNFGVFFQIGESIGFLRALSFAVDAGLGVQVRVP
jgi:hypothetical protein